MNRLEPYLENPPGFLPLTTGLTIDLALRYLFFAGVAWLLGYVLFKRILNTPTNHAEYEERFREVTSQPAAAMANPPAAQPVQLKA